MRSSKVLSISVPPSLWDEIGVVAEKEKMTRSEILRVAARDYIRSRRWAELREKGARTAAKYRVKSVSDVDRILHELRGKRGASLTRTSTYPRSCCLLSDTGGIPIVSPAEFLEQIG